MKNEENELRGITRNYDELETIKNVQIPIDLSAKTNTYIELNLYLTH